MPTNPEGEPSGIPAQPEQNPNPESRNAAPESAASLLVQRFRVLIAHMEVIGYAMSTLPDTDSKRIAFDKICTDANELFGEFSADAKDFVVPLMPLPELEQKISDIEGRLKKFMQ